MNSTGAIMGSGGMVVMDETTCMIDVAKFFLDFTQKLFFIDWFFEISGRIRERFHLLYTGLEFGCCAGQYDYRYRGIGGGDLL